MKFIVYLSFLFFFHGNFAQQPILKTVVQQGHSAAVKVAIPSPNGLWIATGSRDKTIKLWDNATGYELTTLYGHTSTVNDLQFSSDNLYLASSSADNTVALWTVADGKKIWQSPDHNKYTTSVAISPNGKWLAYGGYFDSVYVVAIPSGKRIASLSSNADQGSGYGIDLQFSPDSKWLAIGEDNKTAKLFNTSNWSLYATSTPELGWCGGCGTYVAFSNDSKYLYKMSHNEIVQQYDIDLKKITQSYGTVVDEMYGIYVNASNVLVVASDSILTSFQTTNAKVLSQTKITSWQVQTVHNGGGDYTWVAQSNFKASLYNNASGELLKRLEGFAQQVDKGGLDYDPENYWQRHIANYIKYKNTILLSADEQTIYTGKVGSQCIGWNIATGAPTEYLKEHSKAVLAMDRSNDGNWLVTADGAGTIIIREAKTGKIKHTINAHREPIFSVKINPNGTQIATAAWDASVKLWNIETGTLEQNIYFENNSVYTLAYSPDGLYLVVGQMDNSLSLIEPDSKEVVRTFIGHSGIVSSIRFGKDRNQLFTTSWDGSARSWELSTGMQLQKFKTQSGKVHAGVFYKNNTQVITAGEDRAIRIWNVTDGKLMGKLLGHTSEISDLQISIDNSLLYSYSIDGEIKCWNLNTQKEVYAHIHLSAKDWMATTPTGYFVATEGARKNIHFTKGLQVFSTDQFFDQYYKPDLIQQSIYNRGVGVNNNTLQGSIEKYPPPTVKIATTLSEDGLLANVSIKLINNGGGVKNVKLFHNGKYIKVELDSTTLPKTAGGFVVVKHSCPLVKGQNHLTATAQNTVGIESAEVSSLLYSEKAPHAAKCHVLVLGVNNYTNPNYQLNFARQDAEAFVTQLKKESGDLFEEVFVHAMYDQEVTKKNILDTLVALQKVISYNDVFVFYYAGHGAMVEGNYYFITANCVRAYEKSTLDDMALSAMEMQEQLALIKALKQVIIIDACQSGGSVEVLAMRGVSEEKAFAQLSRSAGIHVMAAAASDQAAKEVVELKHGLFTYVLLKGMMGDADGAPKDGKITVFELKSYMDDQVPEWSSKFGTKAQYPYTFSRGSDFPMLLK
jgi:WD40 repeat protein